MFNNHKRKRLIFILFSVIIHICNHPIPSLDTTKTITNSLSPTIGLLVVATGKYIQFIEPLIRSARQHFCTQHSVTFFIFTDQKFESPKDITLLPWQRFGWPNDTMLRIKAYADYADQYKNIDYLFACDADMLFVDVVGDEILAERTGTLHPGFLHKRGSYESRKISAAYVSPTEGKYYFAGGFWGGTRSTFLDVCNNILLMIDHDKNNNCIAIWHDESYLNRYFINHPPTKILSPAYCFPDRPEDTQRYGLKSYRGKLLALTKDHNFFRSN